MMVPVVFLVLPVDRALRVLARRGRPPPDDPVTPSRREEEPMNQLDPA